MGIESSKDEQSGDGSAIEASTGQTQELVTADSDSSPVSKPRAPSARRTGAASVTRKAAAKTAAKPALKPARGTAGKQLAPGKSAKKSAAKPASGSLGKKSKSRSARKTPTASGTSKMLKKITARLDLSRRQLSAALDDLAALVGRQIGSATAPLPRLVKGEWKTMESFGKQLAGKLGIAGKEQPSKRKRPTAARKSTPKARKTGSKASVSISVEKRPSRSRRVT